ncbi:hypothetical protein HMI54_009617 [Coelomomyces lativittatus]|nr:hypothetical protein HMI54_009617 [Coelomomyces lativittatus]
MRVEFNLEIVIRNNVEDPSTSRFCDTPSKMKNDLEDERLKTYLSKKATVFLGFWNNILEEMERKFLDFDEITQKIFKDIENAKRNEWTESNESKKENFGLLFEDGQMIFMYLSTFNLDSRNDVQFNGDENSNEFRALQDVETLFDFFRLKFTKLLEYLFLFKNEVFCSRVSQFKGVTEISIPVSSPISSKDSTPVVQPFYSMLLLAPFTSFKITNVEGHKTTKGYLRCEEGFIERISNEQQSSSADLLIVFREIVQFTRANQKKRYIILKSKIEKNTKQILKSAVFNNPEDLFTVFTYFFNTILERIPDKKSKLHAMIRDYHLAYRTFFKRLQTRFDPFFVSADEQEVSNFKFQNDENFSLNLKTNGFLVVNWQPLLNLKVLKEEMDAIKRGNVFFEEVLPLMDKLLGIQQNYIKSKFFGAWIQHCLKVND